MAGLSDFVVVPLGLSVAPDSRRAICGGEFQWPEIQAQTIVRQRTQAIFHQSYGQFSGLRGHYVHHVSASGPFAFLSPKTGRFRLILL